MHAVNRASIRGVEMACNTPDLALEGALHLFCTLPMVEGDMA